MNARLRSFLDFALDATWQAGCITLGYFQTHVVVERKADSSPVTAADRGAETKLRELIEHDWPGHSIIGEEFGESPHADRLTWVIDPIDGTKSFVQGVPLYGVLLALLDGNAPLVGVAHFPALRETVYAARGEGCYWNGRRARVSTVEDINRAVVTSSDVLMHDPVKEAGWQRLAKAAYIRRTWGDAYGYALVATGRAEVMVDATMKLWDCAPFQVILEEAGGTFTDWQGTPTVHAPNSVATNGALFEQVMALIKEQ